MYLETKNISQASPEVVFVAKLYPKETHPLVGGFNPIEKNVRQIGSFPQVRVNIKKKLKPPTSPDFHPKQKTHTPLGFATENDPTTLRQL